ncbi:MAG TPA: hypothetical protein RMI62_05245, partial [Polyangiaceae bacterium LLY-WYZ-15_(1-7)]|nr:hypothetical protein [Polyangiaceae bacterium LLY-WYZ-15_(1-7)]
MSRAPDSFELIDLEREGALDEAGARRLGMVLRSHRAVALERALMRDFDRARAERPGDGGVDALVAGALDRFEADTPTTRMPALDAEAAAAVLAPKIDPATLAALEELDAQAPEPGLAPGSTRQWLAVVGAGRAKAPRPRPLVDSTRQWLAVVGAKRARWPA